LIVKEKIHYRCFWHNVLKKGKAKRMFEMSEEK